jgi:hypothetical protein
VSQPLDRTKRIKELGPLDRELGEFWVENPFLMPQLGENLSAYETNCLFMNHGDLHFVDGSFTSNVNLDSDSRSAVPADFNRDGKTDLLVGSVGGGPLRLFRNQLPDRHWLGLRLRGTDSNANGIGARLVFHVGEKKIYRDLFAANGFFGTTPSELLVGLGDAEMIDKIEVRWPSGHVSEFLSVTPDRWLNLYEDDRTPEPLSMPTSE